MTPLPVNILLINPNSSTSMTNAMETAALRITRLSAPSVTIDKYTAPDTAPASINDDDDIRASTEAVLDDEALTECLNAKDYHAILVACFSVHTLVEELTKGYNMPVTGIFEASILTALSLVPAAPPDAEQWGIVTTGEFWENHLSDGTSAFLGHDESLRGRKFAGVFSTGLTAGDFHAVPREDVEAKLREATRRLLLSGNVTCVVMGCGGMAGLQDIIRSVAVDVYGEDRAHGMYVVDGVQAGVLHLQQTVLSRRAFL